LNSFEKALKKGEMGEEIIRKYLEEKGWIVYFPFTKDKPHYFDILATKNKEKVIAVDVKTKARLNKWPAQGINLKAYNEYKKFIEKTNIPFYLIFIDDKNGDVHSANLRKLKQGFSVSSKSEIIAWHLSDMKKLFKLNKDQIKELSKFDQRNYPYEPIEKTTP
jgi:Holliday junction resolvase-like predicted endonuclease